MLDGAIAADTAKNLMAYYSRDGILPLPAIASGKFYRRDVPLLGPTYIVDEGKYPSIFVKSVIQPENYEQLTNKVLRLQALVK